MEGRSLIYFSLKGKKYSGRVCKGWNSANIYLNVLYRIFKWRWENGVYDEDIEMIADFIEEFYRVFFHESLHVLVKQLYGKYHASEKRIEFLTEKILDRFFDCIKEDNDRFFWRFWLLLVSEMFGIYKQDMEVCSVGSPHLY